MSIIQSIKHFFKVRYTAKPFSLYKECVVDKGKNDKYYIGYDGYVYYGSRIGLTFFKSSANDMYWLESDKRRKLMNEFNKH